MPPKARLQNEPNARVAIPPASQGMEPATPTATNLTNYAEIQENEIEVLRSIYMEDFMEVESKPAAWNVGKEKTGRRKRFTNSS